MQNQTLGNFFFSHCNKFQDNISQIDLDSEERQTYGLIKKLTVQLAISLKNLGINRKDVVLLCCKNNLQNCLPYIATLYLGARVSCIDTAFPLSYSRHAIKTVQPKCIFVEESALGLVEECLKKSTLNPIIIVIGSSENYLNMKDLLVESSEEAGFEPIKLGVKETAVFAFSSGSTGLPKCIAVSNEALLYSGLVSVENGAIKTDCMFQLTSLNWISAAVIMVSAFGSGGCRILSSSVTPTKILQAVQDYKITYLFLLPVLASAMMNVDNAKSYDLSSLYSVFIGGMHMAGKKLQEVRNFFNKSFVSILYGSSEAVGCLTMWNRTCDATLASQKLESCGRPVHSVKIKIMDLQSKQSLPANHLGEILFKSAFSMKGYHNNDLVHSFDEEGYIRTGDIGYFDKDGFLYVVDRLNATFWSEGSIVIPSLIENALQEHPAIEQAIVFGVPDVQDELRPAACITLQKPYLDCNQDKLIDEILSFVALKVRDFEQLRGGIKVLDKIFTTPTGKVLRDKVKEQFLRFNV